MDKRKARARGEAVRVRGGRGCLAVKVGFRGVGTVPVHMTRVIVVGVMWSTHCAAAVAVVMRGARVVVVLDLDGTVIRTSLGVTGHGMMVRQVRPVFEGGDGGLKVGRREGRA